jgi:hypothetical protein
MLTIIIVAGGFVLSIVLCTLVLLRVGIGGNKRRGYLSPEAQTRADAVTRALTGLYVRMPERDAQGQVRRVHDDPQ